MLKRCTNGVILPTKVIAQYGNVDVCIKTKYQYMWQMQIYKKKLLKCLYTILLVQQPCLITLRAISLLGMKGGRERKRLLASYYLA
jgi:hypothetical protein